MLSKELISTNMLSRLRRQIIPTTGFLLQTSTAVIKRVGPIVLTVSIAALCVPGFAQSSPEPFVPYKDFIANTKKAIPGDFIGHVDTKLDALARTIDADRPVVNFRVQDEAKFEEMRQAVLARYQDVEVSHSFMIGTQHYDCVPVMQQPAVRNYHLTKIATPPLSLVQNHEQKDGTAESRDVESLKPEFDDYGNATHCDADTVPLLRLTLEMMSRFSSVQEFYQKPSKRSTRATPSAGEGQEDRVALAETQHKYSVLYLQADNLGANATFNIWSPAITVTNVSLAEFSIMQGWIEGGSKSGTQTLEWGWEVSPVTYDDFKSHFFIGSTADNYSHFCANNACGDFVILPGADASVLGSTFGGYSSVGGTQHEFTSTYTYFEGNWWLSRGNVSVGYFPGAKHFGNGQLSKFGQLLEFGTETTGETTWPAAGSGQWGTSGYGKAAYLRQLWYYDRNGHIVWDSGIGRLSNASCYNNTGGLYNATKGNIPQNTSNPSWWDVYFFVGGPGGSSCN
jgi:hypothetical protein